MIELTSLIKLCRQGKRQAQHDLYNRYKRKWFLTCLRYLNSREDANDVLQNALVKILLNLDQFDSEKGTFDTWSNRVVINECLMLIRKNKKFVNDVGLEDYDFLPSESNIVSAMSADELLLLIQKLPDGYRTVFNMYAIEGYSHKEIANTLSITEGTSKSQLFKARNLLRKYLEVLI